MTDIDKELVDILQFVTTEHEKGEFGSPCSTHIRFNKNEADRQIREFIKQSNLALLSRIKEEMLNTRTINHAACSINGESHHPECAREAKLRAALLTTIDNIAKEIRGERHE